MRQRIKKNRDERFNNCIEFEATFDKDNFSDLYKGKIINLEIGSGKGGFITQLAKNYPDEMFFAVERSKDCILMGMEKAKNLELENVLFINKDANKLFELFAPKCVDKLYLNFSDPWPKSSHAKRRLTHRRMLCHFIPLLKDNSLIQFKTDNDSLFDFSLEEFKDLGFDIKFLTYDLHSEDIENYMTEYETRFTGLGVKIKCFKAILTDKARENISKVTKI